MNKSVTATLLALVISSLLISACSTESSHDDHGHSSHGDHEDIPKGPHGGRLLQQDNFAIEITLFEKGVAPEFHVYSYDNGEPIPANDVSLNISLHRLDNEINNFSFSPVADYLRGDGVVTEPHSFDVVVEASYQKKLYHWQYENYEGRVEINDNTAQQSGIATEKAGSTQLREVLNLTGRIQLNPDRLSEVSGRFPGIVTRIHRQLGDTVKRGDILASIQSNDSLQNYNLKAPIDGVIIQRNLQPGEVTGNNALFIIADTSEVWAMLDLFDKDSHKARPGQSVSLQTLSEEHVSGNIDWISPMISHASQSVQARVVIDNSNGIFKPGQFVRAQIKVAEYPVSLAVRKSAVQNFRDFKVVFAKIGETYEVRMLELGREDPDWYEVLGGLKPGTEYVTQNSYLVKADIEKSGASHDH